MSSVKTIASSGVDVYAHNVETVRRLTPWVRDPRAAYDQSLKVLEHAKKVSFRDSRFFDCFYYIWLFFLKKHFTPSCDCQLRTDIITKTSLMLGLGETDEEVLTTLLDLREIGKSCFIFQIFAGVLERNERTYIPNKDYSGANILAETFFSYDTWACLLH